jgi:hypothetical protein
VGCIIAPRPQRRDGAFCRVVAPTEARVRGQRFPSLPCPGYSSRGTDLAIPPRETRAAERHGLSQLFLRFRRWYVALPTDSISYANCSVTTSNSGCGQPASV